MAAWRTKKTTPHRAQRGFNNSQSTSRIPMTSATPKSDNSDVSTSSNAVDAKKASNRYAERNQIGHWKGDPECPKKVNPKAGRQEGSRGRLGLGSCDDRALAEQHGRHPGICRRRLRQNACRRDVGYSGGIAADGARRRVSNGGGERAVPFRARPRIWSTAAMIVPI